MLETALLFSANAGCFPKFYLYRICPGYFQKLQIIRIFGSFQKPLARLPETLELLSTSFNNVYLNLKNIFPPLEKNPVDLPPFV